MNKTWIKRAGKAKCYITKASGSDGLLGVNKQKTEIALEQKM